MQSCLRQLSGISRQKAQIPTSRVGQCIHPRTFSSSAPTPYKYEYLVTIPDKTNALQARLAARPKHLAELKPKMERGQVVFGGANLSEQPKEGETPAMIGSVLLVKADCEEDVWTLLREDQYTKGGAWDVDKAVVAPFKCAIRVPM